MFSASVELLLGVAYREATSRRHTHLTLEHLLYVLAHDTEAERILAACGADLPRLRSELDKFLQQNNLSSSDMNVINVAPPNIASALKTGSVDAVVVWVPHIVNAERSIGKDAVSFPYEFSSNYLLVTTQKVLDKKKAELVSLLKVFAASLAGKLGDSAMRLDLLEVAPRRFGQLLGEVLDEP